MASEARGKWTIVVCVVVALVASPAMGALDVSNLHLGFVWGDYVVNSDLEFYVDGMCTGGALRVDGQWGDYSLLNCWYTLSECPLDEDLTVPGDDAVGRFSDNIGGVAATLTVTGDIYDTNAGATVFDGGTVLEAEVRGSFLGVEVDSWPGESMLAFSLDMEIVGGELSGRIADGMVTDLEFINPMLDAAHTFNKCTQPAYPGLGVVDFGSKIENAMMAGDVHLDAVPEPTCMLLLGIGAFGMYARRKK